MAGRAIGVRHQHFSFVQHFGRGNHINVARQSFNGWLGLLPHVLAVFPVGAGCTSDGKHNEGKNNKISKKSAHYRRSEEHTSELQSLMRISYAVFCLKKKNNKNTYSQSQDK